MTSPDRNDDAFRLTALDVRRYDFGTAFRGYEKARVEQFRDQVAAELERLVRVGQELEQKARNFHEQLRAFRERDRALNDALVAAQQMGLATKDAADREAELTRREAQGEAVRMMAEARREADRVLDDARGEADQLLREAREQGAQHTERLRGEQRRLEEETSSLDRVHRTYLAQLRLMAERQLAEIHASEERTLPPPRRPAPQLESGGVSSVVPLAGPERGERS